MAYRPKPTPVDESGVASDRLSSKIFKSLANSEAGRSFNVPDAMSPKAGGYLAGSDSFAKVESLPRVGSFSKKKPGAKRSGSFSSRPVRPVDPRANEAIQMRESLLGNRQIRGPNQLPRGQTFERAPRKKASLVMDQYLDHDEDEDEENMTPNADTSVMHMSGIPTETKTMEGDVGEEDVSSMRDAAQRDINSRFKSTTHTNAAVDFETEDGDGG